MTEIYNLKPKDGHFTMAQKQQARCSQIPGVAKHSNEAVLTMSLELHRIFKNIFIKREF